METEVCLTTRALRQGYSGRDSRSQGIGSWFFGIDLRGGPFLGIDGNAHSICAAKSCCGVTVGILIEIHCLDLLVADSLVVELKTVAQGLEPIHFSIVRSYMKALSVDSGMLLNFAAMPHHQKSRSGNTVRTRIHPLDLF